MCNLQFTLRNVHTTCVHCKIYIVHSASVHSTLFWYSVHCTHEIYYFKSKNSKQTGVEAGGQLILETRKKYIIVLLTLCTL